MKENFTGESYEGKLDLIQSTINSFEPELRDIGEWYINFVTNDVFKTKGAVIGETWEPLNPKYAKRKAEKYPGRGTLEASGAMRTSWELYTTSHYALIRNKMDYAIYHQEGTSRIPQRMFVKLDQQRKDIIYQKFAEGVLRRIQDAVR